MLNRSSIKPFPKETGNIREENRLVRVSASEDNSDDPLTEPIMAGWAFVCLVPASVRWPSFGGG